jgi:hypothetical protein
LRFEEGKMTINVSLTNWKTTITGIAVILITAAGPVLDHYHPLVGLSWTAITTSIAAAISGVGLVAAKDASTHSTTAQSAAAQATVQGQVNAPELVKAADAQVAAKK